jgi:predicted enzyme related to lactoylglutathione lyase
MRVSSLTLYAGDVEATAEFYRSLGAGIRPTAAGRQAGDVGGCRLAIVPAGPGDVAGPGAPGTAMPGFEVASVDAVVGRVVAGGGTVLRAAEKLDWGTRAVLSDPDGRAVEVVERPA